MTNYKRGDVVLVLFPNSDLQTYKKRPALIIQADNLQTGIPQVIIALITSNSTRIGHPSRITFPLSSSAGKQSGLQTDSVIATDNLATVRERFIDKIIGKIPDLTEVEKSPAHTLGLISPDNFTAILATNNLINYH